MSYLANLHFKIIRELIGVDDYGGAYVTGVVVISEDQMGRLDEYIPIQARTKIQGLEIERSYSLILHYNRQNNLRAPDGSFIRENDIVILTFPPHHELYNKRFRIRGVSLESAHPSDPRGVCECTITRIDETRDGNTN